MKSVIVWKHGNRPSQSVDEMVQSEREVLFNMWVSCSKSAVEALSRSINSGIELKSFSITTMPLGDVHKLMDLGDKTTILWKRITGKIDGTIALYSSVTDILKLADMLLKKETGHYKDLSDENMPVIHEIMNIVAGYYTDKLARMFDMEVTDPSFSADPRKAVDSFGFGNAHGEQVEVLLFKATFSIPESATEGNIVIIFRTESIGKMVYTVSTWKDGGPRPFASSADDFKKAPDR